MSPLLIRSPVKLSPFLGNSDSLGLSARAVQQVRIRIGFTTLRLALVPVLGKRCGGAQLASERGGTCMYEDGLEGIVVRWREPRQVVIAVYTSSYETYDIFLLILGDHDRSPAVN